MNISEHPYLIAYVRGEPVFLVNDPKNAAAFFMEHSLDDIRLCTSDNKTIVTSCGPFIDRCNDMNYLSNQLTPPLIAYQLNPELKPAVQYVRSNGNTRNTTLSR